MTHLSYDGSFAGFLSAVFAVYEYKLGEVELDPQERQVIALFGEKRTIDTDEGKALRVWKGLAKRLSPDWLRKVYQSFLSELPEKEALLLRFVRYAIDSPVRVEQDYSHDGVRFVFDTAKKVHREKHRMEAFVRFQRAEDNLYFCTVEPDFNVLPLIAAHFETRYADQRWLIYDKRRHYGIYYDLHSVSMVSIDADGESAVALELNAEERKFQELWKDYFATVNIAARKNDKLHLKHMPQRYWKYLVEKQPRLK